MWLLGQLTPSTEDLKTFVGPWAASVVVLSSWIAWLIRQLDRERKEAAEAERRHEEERQHMTDRLLSLSEKVEPLAASLVRYLERER